MGLSRKETEMNIEGTIGANNQITASGLSEDVISMHLGSRNDSKFSIVTPNLRKNSSTSSMAMQNALTMDRKRLFSIDSQALQSEMSEMQIVAEDDKNNVFNNELSEI